MFVNLTNIISLCTRDQLIKFEKWSPMKSNNIIHVNQTNYSNPFLFLIYFVLSLLFVALPIDVHSKNWTDY
jgi:hypothetical protein